MLSVLTRGCGFEARQRLEELRLSERIPTNLRDRRNHRRLEVLDKDVVAAARPQKLAEEFLATGEWRRGTRSAESRGRETLLQFDNFCGVRSTQTAKKIEIVRQVFWVAQVLVVKLAKYHEEQLKGKWITLSRKLIIGR